MELTICQCKTTCKTNRCSCKRDGLLCSGACYCETFQNNVEEYSDIEESETSNETDYTDD